MDSSAGEAENYEDPSFELNPVLRSQDRSEDVSLAERERRLHGFQNVRDVSLESSKTAFVQSDATRTPFFYVRDHFPDSGNEELRLDVAEDLKNIPAVTQLGMCVRHNTLSQDRLLADQGNTDP